MKMSECRTKSLEACRSFVGGESFTRSDIFSFTENGRNNSNIDALEYTTDDRVAIMLGAEGPGLTETAMSMATRRVRIPMSGSSDSLNVGNAAAVAFYALRQARKL